LVASLILWAVSGVFFGYQVQVITEFVRAVPDQQRGQAIGIASSGLLAVQGVGVLIGGLVAGAWGVNAAVAAAGCLGVVFALVLSWSWHRVTAAAVREPSNEPVVSSPDRGPGG
jgi:predicted MFS family arabinose efflux permease